MSKKVVIIITTIVIILLAVLGIIYMVKNDSLNEEKADDTASENIAEDSNNENVASVDEDTSVALQGKILIAFFSRADENYSVGTVSVGNTEIMAGFIKDYLGDRADVFKIEPVTAYPADYKKCTEVATEEKNKGARPEFKGDVDISKYDTIIIGYPIWWR